MPYERLRTIGSRLERVLELVGRGGFSASDIADELEVSVPTVARDIAALRDQGHIIEAGRVGRIWQYSLHQSSSIARRSSDKSISPREVELTVKQGRGS